MFGLELFLVMWVVVWSWLPCDLKYLLLLSSLVSPLEPLPGHTQMTRVGGGDNVILGASRTVGGLKGLAGGKCIAMGLEVHKQCVWAGLFPLSSFLFPLTFCSPLFFSLLLLFLFISPSLFISPIHFSFGYSSQVMPFSISCIQVNLVI